MNQTTVFRLGQTWVQGVCSYDYVPMSHMGNIIKRIETTTTYFQTKWKLGYKEASILFDIAHINQIVSSLSKSLLLSLPTYPHPPHAPWKKNLLQTTAAHNLFWKLNTKFDKSHGSFSAKIPMGETSYGNKKPSKFGLYIVLTLLNIYPLNNFSSKLVSNKCQKNNFMKFLTICLNRKKKKSHERKIPWGNMNIKKYRYYFSTNMVQIYVHWIGFLVFNK